MIHVGELVELRLPAGALDLLGGKRNQVVDVPDVAILQQRIAEHGGQRRRHRHGHPPLDAVAFQAIEDFQQRDVGLGDGFVKPIFFEEIVVLRMPDERQMGVQDQAEITQRHQKKLGTGNGERPECSVPSSAWDRTAAKHCFASLAMACCHCRGAKQSFVAIASQAEPGTQKIRS